MNGRNLERAIKSILVELGYEVLSGKNLGWTSEELVNHAVEHGCEDALKYMAAVGLDPRGCSPDRLLDEIFKVDVLIRHNGRVKALQLSSSNEVEDFKPRLTGKIRKGKTMQEVLNSLFIDDYVIWHLVIPRDCDSLWSHSSRLEKSISKLMVASKWAYTLKSIIN